MQYTPKTKDFFSHIPSLDAQFGNLLTLREKADYSFPGFPECYVSSVLQFQPLLQVEVFDKTGKNLPMKQTHRSVDPVKREYLFEGEKFEIHQTIIVKGDQAFVELDYTSSIDADIYLSGSCLLSPQGIPYHWDEEGTCKLQIVNNQEIKGFWKNLSFSLATSVPMESVTLSPLQAEEVVKNQYFTSHNLKKRHTYWVEEETRRKALDSADQKSQSRNSRYCLTWKPKQKDSVTVQFSLNSAIPDTYPTGKKSIEEAQIAETVRWNDFIQTIPQFDCTDTRLKRMYYTSWYILFAGKISFLEERMEHPFTSVNKFHYYNQFFWDSAFQTIAWLWNNESTHAEQEMKNFVANQWRNGMIPYELFMYPINGREWMDGDAKTSGTTQPPVIGITLDEVYAKFGNDDYLEFFYDSLIKYDQWLTLYRDLGNRGLSAYTNIWESGWDNSPRFDVAARNRVLDPFIEGVDFNVYIYLMRDSILKMAQILGKQEPEGIRAKQELTKKSMNSLMYCQEDGFYYDLEAGTDTKVLVKTAAGLLPLMTDIPIDTQRNRLINDYLLSEKEFLTGTPVPSVSRSEPTYCSYDFWRGANWPQITWSILYGIESSYPEEAAQILDRFLSSTIHNENCYEYYDAEDGDGAGLPFHGWGALYTDFIIRFVVGIHPQSDGFDFHSTTNTYHEYALKDLIIHGLNINIERNLKVYRFDIAKYGTLSFPSDLRFSLHQQGSEVEILWEEDCQAVVDIMGNHLWKTKKELILKPKE